MYYIAGPFFTREQKMVIADIETILDSKGKPYFSPREFGIIKDTIMTDSRMKRIFDMNIRMIEECENIIAVTDDYDPGTMFELGLFHSKTHLFDEEDDWNEIGIVITYSPSGYGVNVMLKYAIKYHCRNIEDLEAAFDGHGSVDLEVIE